MDLNLRTPRDGSVVFNANAIQTLPEWATLDPAALHGTTLLLGDVNTGKTTFARYLFLELCRHYTRVALLDLDTGQSTLGPPTTLGLALASPDEPYFPPRRNLTLWFVGSTSPRGHMLPAVVGARRLQERAQALGAEAILVDTTGLIDPAQGGVSLKHWKIEALQPTTIIALHRCDELEPILAPLRHDPRFALHELPVSSAVRSRNLDDRAARRQAQFRLYFSGAQPHQFSFDTLAIYDELDLAPGRLVAFQGRSGFTLALGIIAAVEERRLQVLTPLRKPEAVANIRVGRLWVDVNTGRHTSG